MAEFGLCTRDQSASLAVLPLAALRIENRRHCQLFPKANPSRQFARPQAVTQPKW
jgi:hypothetical protein